MSKTLDKLVSQDPRLHSWELGDGKDFKYCVHLNPGYNHLGTSTIMSLTVKSMIMEFDDIEEGGIVSLWD